MPSRCPHSCRFPRYPKNFFDRSSKSFLESAVLSVGADSVVIDQGSPAARAEEVNPMPAPIPEPGPEEPPVGARGPDEDPQAPDGPGAGQDARDGWGGPGGAWVPGSADTGPGPRGERPGPQPAGPGPDGLPAGGGFAGAGAGVGAARAAGNP